MYTDDDKAKYEVGAMENSCPLCQPGQMVAETDYWVLMWDEYPVSEGHMLVVLKRHTDDFWGLSTEEWHDLHLAMEEAKKMIDDQFAPEGYNIGSNLGEVAGQTVPHVHVHLIPRYQGDHANPRGGIRNVRDPLVDY